MKTASEIAAEKDQLLADTRRALDLAAEVVRLWHARAAGKTMPEAIAALEKALGVAAK